MLILESAALPRLAQGLGRFISKKGIEVDPQKIRAIKEQPISTNVHEICGFLELTGYYQRGFSIDPREAFQLYFFI